MAKQLNILYGFNSEKIQESITKEIALRGFGVKPVRMTTKLLIKDYVNKHPELDAIILKEYLDGGGVYSAIELTELLDNVRNLNVVIVIATNHRGKNEMKELYSAGILNAFFSDGKFGANPDKLAELVTKGRTRKEAREYYKINEVVPDHINLTYEEFRDNYRYLVDDRYGMNIINRFVQISRTLYPGQMGAFIDDLPEKVKQILGKYIEFYDVANKVYKLGYSKEKYKMPKSAVYGINKEDLTAELIKETKREKETFEPVLTSVQSSSEPQKKEVEYDEPLGLEREDSAKEDEPVIEQQVKVTEQKTEQAKGKKQKKKKSEKAPKEKKERRGLFSKRKRQQPDREESIFEQESDVDFELEGVDAEPISDTDDWGTPQFDSRELDNEENIPINNNIDYEEIAARKERPDEVQAEVAREETSKAENDIPPIEEGQAQAKVQVAEPVSEIESDTDLDNLSVEELKKLLGN